MGIDLSRAPYFDDFSSNDNYYQVIFRPAVAVQTRELNQLQSILQDQIAKFGRNILKDGTIVEGCPFSIDNRYTYVKINDNYANGTAFTIDNFKGLYVENELGLLALVVDTVAGYQSQDPYTNVLYIKYVNSVTALNGSQQSAFSNSENLRLLTSAGIELGEVSVFTPNTANPNSTATGVGYAFSVGAGTIFKDNYFIEVKPQTCIVSPFDNTPDGVSVGFISRESIVTPEANSKLNDNSVGSPNYAAPGAHRYQLIPELITMESADVGNTTPFFPLAKFQDGAPIVIRNDTQYAILGAEMARRTYETNGDFIVNPFLLTTEPKDSEDPKYATHDNLVCSSGLGYVKGYRAQFLNQVTTDLQKATSFRTVAGTVTTISFGSYVTVENYCGDFNVRELQRIELHTGNTSAITSGNFLGAAYSGTTKIGTAYIRGLSYVDGVVGTGADQYQAYLFNVQMSPGYAFSQVNSLRRRNVGNTATLALADIIPTVYNPSTNTYVTGLSDSKYDKLIYPTGQKALKLDGFDNQSFVYRNSTTASFSDTTNGAMTITLGAPIGTASENFDSGGFLTGQAADTFTVVPTQNGFSTNKTGTVNALSGDANVGGTATTFLTDYTSGDFIYVNNVLAQVNVIYSNVLLRLTAAYGGTTALANTHRKAFPQGVPIAFDNRGSHGGKRSIAVSGNTATVTIGEALSASFNAETSFDVLRSYTRPIKKQYTPHVYVAITCGTHPNGTNGPFSLGFADIANVNAIYVSRTGLSNTTPDFSPVFNFDNGQRDGYYDLATITPKSGFLTPDSNILVDLNVYIYDQSQGVGYFNANSYPIDDNDVANTTAIQTQDIPRYKSSDGHTFDLRDCIDFRPFANNTASAAANSENWASAATLNPSGTLVFPDFTHTPAPDSTYITDIQFYLPRIDKAVLTTGGVLAVIQGVASSTPIAPLDSLSAMTLGIIKVPPYPSLSTPDARDSGRYDYAVTISLTQNQRYTMKDIGFLAERVEQLEYYSSLTLLEEQAKKAFPSNIFQNGFVVDPFTGFNMADTLDPTFNCCIDADTGVMRPALSVYTKALWTNQERVPVTDSLVGICSDCDQNQASEITSCTQQPYNYCYGRIEFQPVLFCSPDFSQDPDVVDNLANNANYVNISTSPVVPSSSDWRNPYGMQWRYWKHYAANNNPSANNLSGTTDIYGNVLQLYQSSVTSNTQQSKIIINNLPGYTIESIQIDTNILDYTRCRDVDFIARGLKANTNVRMFIGTYDVSNYVRQCSKGFAEETFGNYGATIKSDTTGSIFGRLTIPGSIFKEGVIQVTVIDNANNITTRADGYLQTSFTDWSHWRDIDCTDQVANYEVRSGVTKKYLPQSTLITVGNTTFLNKRTQGGTDLTAWNTYFNSVGRSTWQRFPSQSYTVQESDDWNPTYLAANGFRSFDRKGQDVCRITYGVTPDTKNR
jgi:hypothetical protein